MTALFRRAFKLNVQGRLIEGLDIEFRIDRSLKASQNTGDITIFNLSDHGRKFLQSQKKGVIVELRAGYAPANTNVIGAGAGAALDDIGIHETKIDLPLIFLGQLREVTSIRNGADWQTQLSSGDSDKEKKRPVAFSFGPGAQIEHVLKRLVADMGAKAGNLAAAIVKGKFADAGKQFVEGVTAYGTGDDELGKLLKGIDLEHSWQNGELQVLPRDGGLEGTAVQLTEDSGLVGSPELGDLGSVKFRSLLNSEIAPGRVVHVEAQNVNAFFIVKRATYTGAADAGTDWYVDCEGVPRA